MKAVVLEIKDRNAAVLTADGRFLSVPDGGYGPGLEIELPDSLIEADASGEDLPEEELFDAEPETGAPEPEGGTMERPGAGGNIFFLKGRREKKQRGAGKTAGRGRAGCVCRRRRGGGGA